MVKNSKCLHEVMVIFYSIVRDLFTKLLSLVAIIAIAIFALCLYFGFLFGPIVLSAHLNLVDRSQNIVFQLGFLLPVCWLFFWVYVSNKMVDELEGREIRNAKRAYGEAH